MHRAARHHADFLALADMPVFHPDQDHHAQILVVPAIHHQRLQRRRRIPGRRRQLGHNRFQHAFNVQPGLGADHHRVGRIQPDHVLNLLLHLVRLGRRQVHLVQHRHNFVIGVHRLIHIGQRLRFHPLRGIHHQQRAFARRQAARHLIGKIHMPRRVHQVQLIGFAILGRIRQAHRLRLDGNPALFLQLHIVEHLLGHFPRGQPAGVLDQPIGQGGFPVVDMGDDGEIANEVERRVGHGGQIGRFSVCVSLGARHRSLSSPPRPLSRSQLRFRHRSRCGRAAGR